VLENGSLDQFIVGMIAKHHNACMAATKPTGELRNMILDRLRLADARLAQQPEEVDLVLVGKRNGIRTDEPAMLLFRVEKVTIVALSNSATARIPESTPRKADGALTTQVRHLSAPSS